MSESRNFFLAIGLSLGVLLLWQFFIAGPAMEEQRAAEEAAKAAAAEAGESAGTDGTTVPAPQTATTGDIPMPSAADTGPATQAAGTAAPTATGLPREAALAQSRRIKIDSPGIEGSISLTGARIDDVRLKRYRETTDDSSPIITLLSPRGAENAYYAQIGWVAQPGLNVKLPAAETVWTPVSNAPLTPSNPLQLYWENGEGLRFSLRYEIDEDYLITVTQSVSNTTGNPVTLFPYGLMARHGEPVQQGFWILHEGFLGVFDDTLEQETFSGASETGLTLKASKGWLGITSKYWMTALAPQKDQSFTTRFKKRMENGVPVYQADFMLAAQTVAAGGNAQVTNHVFAGAKKVSIIDKYEEAPGIPRFDLAIDWGWFFFLTKPFFLALDFFAKLTGNFGVAILLLTIVIKLIFFPLANKSYEAMTKMKKVQPEMQKIRDRNKDDKVKQQQELMELYKREKINPLAGCLPIVIQIPVFFSLYKVLFVTLEMRHAPFFGWVQDLSAPDPSQILNLFGLIPWDPSAVPFLGIVLGIGIWPLLMGITMWLQMQMNPKPTDEIQRTVFAWMPILFTFMLASFSAGLVIYWAWNNFLSIIQQYVIMRRMGVEPEWKNNIRLPGWITSAMSRGPKEEAAEPADAVVAPKAQGALSSKDAEKKGDA